MNKNSKHNYAELASVGYPYMRGIRLRYRDGSGQVFDAEQLHDDPETVVRYINNWMADQLGLIEEA